MWHNTQNVSWMKPTQVEPVLKTISIKQPLSITTTHKSIQVVFGSIYTA